MFETQEVSALYIQFRPIIGRVLSFVNALNFRDGKEEINRVQAQLDSVKDQFSCSRDQVLNEHFVLHRYWEMLSNYLALWEKIANSRFGSSWNSLQDALSLLRTVKRYASHGKDQGVDFFVDQLSELEKLYPYNVFFSIGTTVDWFKCSICQKNINTLDCPHLSGEVYRGELAYGIAQGALTLNHVAMVKNPRDKRCVVTYDDNGEQFKCVRFLYNLVSSGKLKPLDFGYLKFSKRRVKNPDFRMMERNEPCYCGSGEEFKRCCISKDYIDTDHVDIVQVKTIIHRNVS